MDNTEAEKILIDRVGALTESVPGHSYPSAVLRRNVTLSSAHAAVAAMTWCVRQFLPPAEDSDGRFVRNTWEILLRCDYSHPVATEMTLDTLNEAALRGIRRLQLENFARHRTRSTIPELALKVVRRITVPPSSVGVTLRELCRGYRRLLDEWRADMLLALEDVLEPQLEPVPQFSKILYQFRRRVDPVAGVMAAETLQSFDPATGQLNAGLVSVLADVLEDLPFPETTRLLEHLRRPGPHYPGCWVITAIEGAQRGGSKVLTEQTS